jgi:SAM-dependent methyltransferase
MLVPLRELAAYYDAHKGKLDAIMRARVEAPVDFRLTTEHFASMATVFPYLYHAALVERTLAKGGVADPLILDWGAYLGQVTYMLKDKYAVDAYNPVRNDLIDYWHRQFGVTRSLFGEKSDLREGKVSLPANTYDAVICSGVLEHTFEFGMEDVRALRELHRVLKDDGYLFIWHLPCANSWEERQSRRPGAWRHILAYELDEILVKLSLTGYRIVGIEKNNLIFGALVALLGWAASIPRIWAFETWLASTRLFGPQTHDFTIVCRKEPGFPEKPAANNYTFFVP